MRRFFSLSFFLHSQGRSDLGYWISFKMIWRVLRRKPFFSAHHLFHFMLFRHFFPFQALYFLLYFHDRRSPTSDAVFRVPFSLNKYQSYRMDGASGKMKKNFIFCWCLWFETIPSYKSQERCSIFRLDLEHFLSFNPFPNFFLCSSVFVCMCARVLKWNVEKWKKNEMWFFVFFSPYHAR